MRLRLLFITVWLFSLSIGLMPLKAGADCKLLLPSRLTIGGQGVVLPGPANTIRAEPSTSAERLGTIPGNGVFDVLDGPVCAEGYPWWQVNYDGLQGWTTEGQIGGDYYVTAFADGKPKWYGERRDPVFTDEGFPVDSSGRVTVYNVSMILAGAPSGVISAEGAIYDSVNPYNTEFPFWYVLPAHVQLTVPFFDPAAQTELGSITINVYPAALYDMYYPGSIEALHTALETRPPEGIFINDLLMRNAALVMAARPAYLDMPWGTAYRDLRHRVQTYAPVVTGYEYGMVGLTTDGRYYIEASTFVTAAMPDELLNLEQPAGYPDVSSDVHQAYMDAISQSYQDGMDFLNGAPAEAFTPPLERIDQVMAALEIAPDTLADYWDIPPELIDFPLMSSDESG